MSIPDPWLLGFAVTALLLVLGATSGLVNAKLWVSEPLVCAAFGVALGPFGAGLLRLDATADPQAHDSPSPSPCWPPRSACPGAGSAAVGAVSPWRSGRACC
jgi:hypothetical protein